MARAVWAFGDSGLESPEAGSLRAPTLGGLRRWDEGLGFRVLRFRV